MKRSCLLAFSGLASLFFWGCPTSPIQNNYDYLRSPITFRVDTVPSFHPFCSQGGDIPFPSVDSCQHSKKYALRWERPEDTTGFLEYRIYLDTTPPAAGAKSWNEVRQDSSLASAIVPGSGGTFDSLVFVFGNVNSGKKAPRGVNRIVSFDTSGRIDGQGRLVFAIVAVYQGRTDGPPRYTWVITNDKFAPFPLHPSYTSYDRRVEIAWGRPLDPTSFFDPGADTGVIRQYVLLVVRGGILSANRSEAFEPQVHFENGGADWSARVRMDSFVTSKGAPGRRFVLPDSQRVYNRLNYDPRDSLKVLLGGFIPQDTLDISLWAIDASGNLTPSETTLVNRVILTDTTEPLTPDLRLIQDSASRNRIVYAFTASRDRVERGGVLSPADSPNANIREYRVTRRLISGSAGGIPSKDTVITIVASNRRDTLFVDTVRFLPPGATYRIYAQAMDSTGHLSARDSLDAFTLPVNFQGADSVCLAGFVPIPAASFLLGDTSSVANTDEKLKTVKRRFIGSFCIETYEHRDSLGRFQTRMTWEQAQAACREISPSDNTHLCTEAEWERACEGPDIPGLNYGFQSESAINPNAVLGACNVGTGDSVMATTLSLRNPICLTREGVFDMPGNLAEWVLDPYSSTAYDNLGDTLVPGQAFAAQTSSGTHGYRGSYYLDSHQPSATKLRLARCSNRDYPTQIRPKPYGGCVDSAQPLVVLTYNNSLPPRCLSIPDSLRNRKITAVSPTRDSTKLLFLVDGVAQPVTYALPYNQDYKSGKPLEAKLTPRALAAVVFENSQTGDTVADTLDATEMVDTSQSALTAIFNREVAFPWSVHRDENGRYAIKFLYAYSQLHSIPAGRQYSNSAIGFRCCSRPLPSSP